MPLAGIIFLANKNRCFDFASQECCLRALGMRLHAEQVAWARRRVGAELKAVGIYR